MCLSISYCLWQRVVCVCVCTFNDLQLYSVVREIKALADGLHHRVDEFFPSLCARHIRDIPTNITISHHFLRDQLTGDLAYFTHTCHTHTRTHKLHSSWDLIAVECGADHGGYARLTGEGERVAGDVDEVHMLRLAQWLLRGNALFVELLHQRCEGERGGQREKKGERKKNPTSTPSHQVLDIFPSTSSSSEEPLFLISHLSFSSSYLTPSRIPLWVSCDKRGMTASESSPSCVSRTCPWSPCSSLFAPHPYPPSFSLLFLSLFFLFPLDVSDKVYFCTTFHLRYYTLHHQMCQNMCFCV
jgi:hypothetical protein